MPSRAVVLVHGNPETQAVWDPLLAALDRTDVLRLSPPGFGAPLLPSFEATMTGYRDWLIAQLEAFKQPVHLVGHDWGGLHVMNVATARPDLLRSWVSDAAGVYDPDYIWHSLARTWQTPRDGETWVEAAFTAPLQQRVDVVRGLLAASAPADTGSFLVARCAIQVAQRMAAGQDEDMGQAVLRLYRSAVQPAMTEAGRALGAAAARPGLVIDATADDLTGSSASRARIADLAGARTACLEGLGHWWMVQDPHRSARVLTAFWDSLP